MQKKNDNKGFWKVGHRGQNIIFSDLDVTIDNGIFVYKPFKKSYVKNWKKLFNQKFSMVYKSSEFLKIVRYKFRLPDSNPRTFKPYSRIVAQGRNRNKISQQIKKLLKYKC